MSITKTIEPTQTEDLKKSLLTLIVGIQNDPKQAKAVFKAKSNLKDGFLAEVNIRDFTFLSDEPQELGGTNHGPHPVEYVLGAFAACQEIVVKAYATVLGIEVSSVNVEIEGKM